LPLIPELHRLYERVSLKSQRVDILEHTPALLEAEVAADKRSYTLGIEGISEQQRAFLHKSLPTVDIVGLLERLYASKIREVKLFYILTGHEDEEDVAEFRHFVRQVKAIRRNPRIRTIFSFGLLIRMPFTPLRHDRLFLDERPWRQRVGQVKSACETNGFEFRLAYDWQTYCVSQALALGGHWLHEAIVALAREGHCFDTALPEGYWEQLRAWMVHNSHWNDAFLGEKGPSYPFALDFVRGGVPPAFLYRQYEQARAGVDDGYCLGSADGHGHCLGCEACTETAQRESITHHHMAQPDAGPYLARLREIVARKRRLAPAYYCLRLETQAGVRPAFRDTLAFRAILARYPELTDDLLAVREALFAAQGRWPRGGGGFPTMGGESVYALYAWDAEALRRALSAPRDEAETGFAVLGPAEGFAPESGLERLHLDLHLPAAFFPQGRQTLEDYLREAYVPYSLRREDPRTEGATRYTFDVPPKGLKKRALFGGHFEAGEAGLTASLEVGPRLDLLALLGGPSRVCHAEIRVSEIRW
jgi:hypothetical protein